MTCIAGNEPLERRSRGITCTLISSSGAVTIVKFTVVFTLRDDTFVSIGKAIPEDSSQP